MRPLVYDFSELFVSLKKYGVLKNKTEQEKREYFEQLLKIADTDEALFHKKHREFTNHELTEFGNFLREKTETLQTLKQMVALIDKLAKEVKKKKKA